MLLLLGCELARDDDWRAAADHSRQPHRTGVLILFPGQVITSETRISSGYCTVHTTESSTSVLVTVQIHPIITLAVLLQIRVQSIPQGLALFGRQPRWPVPVSIGVLRRLVRLEEVLRA